jgi:hypothetical protein
VFPYSKWGAELNAKITPAFFTWLVGPMETVEADINGEKQKSAVHIKKCRYPAGLLSGVGGWPGEYTLYYYYIIIYYIEGGRRGNEEQPR